jgi:lysozyme
MDLSVAQDAAPIAANLITPFEGFSSIPYQDPAGVWTIGNGSTRDLNGDPVTASTPPITDIQAKQLLMRDLSAAVTTVANDVLQPITKNMAAALEDFVYNLGPGDLASSTLLKLLNAGQYAEAAAQFDLWDHSGGVELSGLLRRREAERQLFMTPDA